MTFFKIDNIYKTFQINTPQENPVLKGLSLEANEGDFISVIGGNGAGKSTLLNSIAGSFPIDQGSIMIQGEEMTKLSEEARAKRIARVFQDPLMGTAPRMTVAENMAISLKRGEFRGLSKTLTDEVRERFQAELSDVGLGLENRLNEEVGSLSGGQRQIIAMLMATLKKPDVLLLDEHVAALDPHATETVMELTKNRVEKDNITTLMITHNMQHAIDYGNRLVMMDQGKIIVNLTSKEKQNLSVDDLIDLFKKKSSPDSLSDRVLLS